MSQASWIRSVTRPVGHLIGTIAVYANLIICGIVATMNPQWQPPLVVIGTGPLVVWFTVMAVRQQRSKTRDL